MASSKSVVLAAFFANGAIAVLKFIGFSLTGSPAMLSETYHSISDTGNQVFLLIGLRYGSRSRTREHPFGYGKAQFFYSFLVSVMLFGIAGWESAKHGYHALTHPELPGQGVATLPILGSFDAIYVNYAVLIGAILFESYALKLAYQNMAGQIEEQEWSGLREAFRKTSDVTVLTALTEDAIAMAGAGIALLGVFLTRVTQNPFFDAASAFLIGLMLMGFAAALAWENKRLLLGESLPKDEERMLRGVISDHEAVTDIIDFRTLYFGPEHVVLTADVAFRDDIETEELDAVITEIEDALTASNNHIQKVYIEPE
jgi:cation diffusion facilitator family transporter